MTTAPKHVYVVFFATNLLMGKMIRLVTHQPYNHVSLAFEEELPVMYSFARRHINSPLVGGFVTEYPSRFFQNNKTVPIKICRVPVTAERFAEIEDTVGRFLQKREDMLYNSFGALFSLFHKRIRIHDAYTCVEFVSSILGMEHILSVGELEAELDRYRIYTGMLDEISHGGGEAGDGYFDRQRFPRMAWDLVCHFRHLLLRTLVD